MSARHCRHLCDGYLAQCVAGLWLARRHPYILLCRVGHTARIDNRPRSWTRSERRKLARPISEKDGRLCVRGYDQNENRPSGNTAAGVETNEFHWSFLLQNTGALWAPVFCKAGMYVVLRLTDAL